ncbi:MAG TPA: hypothetical protein VK755_13080, partial [Candidatus Acidoferrales bacterium]|nr:hypothetical protein [Candidatus Acidoferrales bacterium]
TRRRRRSSASSIARFIPRAFRCAASRREGTEMDLGGSQFCVDGSVVAAPFSSMKSGHGRSRVPTQR